MVQITEGTFEVDGQSLHSKTWLPDEPPKAKFIMIHGFSDHVDRYYDFFPSLARRGIAVYAYDQRGWGKSVKTPADKGRTGPTERVLADMAAFIEPHLPASADDKDALPVFVCGHSMGGGQVLTLASTPEYEGLVARVRGFILESPFVGFAPELAPSWLLVASGRLASKVMPNFHMVQPIPPEDVTRIPEIQQSVRDDELLHFTGTLQGLAGMLDRTEGLSSGTFKLSKKVRSLILMHGDADKATSFDKSKEWFDRQQIEDGEFRRYEGMYHQMHADTGMEKFYQDVGDWILERVEGSRTADAKL